MKVIDFKNNFEKEEFREKISYIYACPMDEAEKYEKRFEEAINGLLANFGECDEIRLFSAPGRTELGGNHTDHQHGCVLAASLNLDVIGAVSLNGENVVRILSKGYPKDEISLDDLTVKEEEKETSKALIKGILYSFRQRGYELKGFNAYTLSSVLKGSGMSSSAAFEVLVGNIVNEIFAFGEVSAVEIAKIGQHAENVYFGKPSGLMDQMASSVGGIVSIDFCDIKSPKIEKVEFDFTKSGFALCIIDSGADHADLTSEYGEITIEMKKIANFFGKDFLREVEPEKFYKSIKKVREKINDDRAILRAIHFFSDNKIAKEEAKDLKNGDFSSFLKNIQKSGNSSYMYLQNIYSLKNPSAQSVSLSLALCEKLLDGKGAWRVHGGGFAGTVQAFVPIDILGEFKKEIEGVLGEGMCHVLSIRPVGGLEIK